MFAAKRDPEDGQPELRAELDAGLKALLNACNQARKVANAHPQTLEQRGEYDAPLWTVVEFISSKIRESKDGNFFPRSRGYIRQQALNGKLQLWGRRQLDLPGPLKEVRNFSQALTLIPRGYWAISQLSAACTAPQEYADRIPFTFQEQPGSWPEETNTYYDIHANWQQVENLVVESQNLGNAELPAKYPKVRPVSYGQKSEENSRIGLIVTNDGEPAYDISIPAIQVGQFKIKITSLFTRLSKEEGPKLCAVSIENPTGTLFSGEALADVMRLQDAGRIPFSIRFRDSDGHWYVTRCSLELETTMMGGIVNLHITARFLEQCCENSK
jgi:hypothetical protein